MILYLETTNNLLKRSSLELITAARLIANGDPIIGVGINLSAAHLETAGEYGLSEGISLSVDEATPPSVSTIAATLAELANEKKATVILMAANSSGKDIAPRVAVLTQAGLLPDCITVHRNGSTIEAERPVFAGKAIQRIRSNTPVSVLTLRPNVFTAKKADATVNAQLSERTIHNASGLRTANVVSSTRNQGVLDVAEADIIVSGGRGLKGPEHFTLVENLAAALGGAVGASRAVVDAGWRPHREQVGQTGKTVSPTMYIACGISGAVQHLAGMSSSKIIVAINKDKDAPIFKIADYGIVGDVFEVLPKLTFQISSIVQKH